MSHASLRYLLVACSMLALACTDNSPNLIPRDDGGVSDAGFVPLDAGSPCENGMRDGDETSTDCGGDVCEPCDDGLMCIEPSDCKSGVCNRGFCLTRSCSDGVRNGPEVGVDCGGDCGLCPNGETCSSSAECQSHHCSASMCVPAECDDGRKNGQESDTDCGGDECAPCGAGLSCATADDCNTLRCSNGTCAPASCSDRIQNQDETSVDCGGAICAPCDDLLECEFDLDCESRRCYMGGCISCSDSVRNADESDVDCGGASCEGCRDGNACNTDSDCRSERCLDGLCISCTDEIQNADETDVDCGGSVCDGCANGLACSVDSDCLSNTCADGVCVGYGDTCTRPGVLVEGLNTVNWVATASDYLTSPPSCSSTSLDGPDVVLSYTATIDGVLAYSIAKPASNRWTLVISSGPCGQLTPEVQCFWDSARAELSSQIPVTAGTTYYFYLSDTTSGSSPLSSPLEVTIDEFVPQCEPGVGGVVGSTVTRLTTDMPFVTEYFVVADQNPTGYVYIGGTSYLFRVPKAGGAHEDVESLAGLLSSDMGYEMVIAGNDIFTIDDTTGTSNRVVRISSDGGATWISGGESYASFGTTPNEEFRGAAVYIEAGTSTLYLITHDATESEIWSVPLGATTLPVAATHVGTIPQSSCSGLAVDASYFYTACYSTYEVVRIDRTTFATSRVATDDSISSTRNAIAIDDTDGDGIGDVVYFNIYYEEVRLACGLDDPTPLDTTLASWGTGTSNYGLSFDAASNTIYAYDDDTDELIIIQ